MLALLGGLSLVLFVSWISTVYAQGTAATCASGFDWMTNSREQSPCLVASWLYVPCYGPGAPSVVSKIGPGVNYGGPPSMDPSESTPCDCNTVLYSLRAACGQCQGGGAQPWLTYTFNCATTYIQIYPETIPNGTAVPQWAYLNLINGSDFDVSAARNLALQNPPDATDTTSTTSSARVGTSTTVVIFSPTSATMMGTSAPTKNSNVGVIAGGVIGGVLGFIFLIAAGLYIVFRRRRRIRTDHVISASSQAAQAHEVFYSDTSYHSMKGAEGSIIGSGVLYDPDDPRTYPPPIEAIESGVTQTYTGIPQIMS